MTPRKVFLDELNTSSKNYKVKAKVISKDRPQTGQESQKRYQGLLLMDDKGNKMRGALFGAQLQAFRDAIVYNGTYEISNAKITPMEDRYRRDPAELSFQMSFNPQTLIQAMDTEQGPALPEYRAIGQIPKAGDPSEKYDLLGIVLVVDEEPRQANLAGGRKVGVTEIVLVDHSTQQPLSISAWGDLAVTASELLASKSDIFRVVGFTALKVSRHKGFSVSTTMSSDIILQPAGDRAVALENWCNKNPQKLLNLKTRILHSRASVNEKLVITIAALNLKRATNTLQDDRYWLRVAVPDAGFSRLSANLGCSRCGRYSSQPAAANYTCAFCSKDNCVSVPRVVFSCDVADGTGTLPITAYTENAEKLFRLPAQDIFRIKHSEDLDSFGVARELMAKTSYLLEVGPKTSLSLSNILEWTVKQVVLEVPVAASEDNPKEDGHKTLEADNGNQCTIGSSGSQMEVPASAGTASETASDAAGEAGQSPV